VLSDAKNLPVILLYQLFKGLNIASARPVDQ
jgi:hypothetical protein